MVDYPVKCMVCEKATTVSAPKDTHTLMLFMVTARVKNWQTTMNQHGLFLCCTECVKIAYSDNGRLGFLKDEWTDKMVKEDGRANS